MAEAGTPPQRRISVLGLGNMGAAMAGRLLAAGHQVTVHNRTRGKADALLAAGARWAATPAEAAAAADVLLVSLADETVVERMLFDGAVAHLRPGAVVVDTSTVSPAYARAAEQRLDAAKLRRVEACVVGNPRMAQTGELRIFAAGAERDIDEVQDLLAVLGQRSVLRLGDTGNAMALKLACNLLLGAQTVALAEAIALVEQAGLDRDLLLNVIGDSGFSSAVMRFRGEFMRRRHYQPAAFRARLMEKDLRLATSDAAKREVSLPLTMLLAERFAAVVADGRGDEDAAAVADLAADGAPAPGHSAVATGV